MNPRFVRAVSGAAFLGAGALIGARWLYLASDGFLVAPEAREMLVLLGGAALPTGLGVWMLTGGGKRAQRHD